MNTQFVKVNLIAIASLLLCVLDIRISEASVTIDANRVGVENIAQNNSAQEWVRRGNSHYDSGRHSHALEAYDRALQINPDYEIAWTYRGATLRALRRYEESLASYDRALQIDPSSRRAIYGRGRTLGLLGRHEESLQALVEVNAWEDADSQTWKLILRLGDSDESGSLSISEIQQISCTDLQRIDSLWSEASSGRFGISSQLEVINSIGETPQSVHESMWENKTYDAWRRFGAAVGWISFWSNETYSYKSLSSYDYTLNAPTGHLPALIWTFGRGTPPFSAYWSEQESVPRDNLYSVFLLRASQCNL